KKVILTTEELARVVEVWTGIPASSITELEYEKIDRLGTRIKERIVGQEEAVDAVVRAIKRSRAGISYKKKPVSFIFAGPTGVGKTELVKTLADQLFDSPETLIRLDMTEFMEKHSVSRIIGAPPGYVGYDDAGQLTEKIRRKPYSVVLFDEIEKAHPDVLNILLQILDDGRVTDAQGRQVNFENTVIVMTTNAGASLASGTAGFGKTTNEQSADKTQRALEQFLRPEFLNRVDEIITFRQLNEQDFASIAKIMLNQLAEVLSDREITLNYTESAAQYVAKNSYSVKYGARNMRRYIQKNVEDEIASKIIGSYAKQITAIHLDEQDGALQIVCL
ncbi:MAG: AAA family ATPase, partial [Clostridia bacterium]|nr:AAA family ATPase [Clostridia bacterium]